MHELHQMDLRILSAIQRERQAEMLREARNARLLRDPARAADGARRRLLMLVVLLLPSAAVIAGALVAANGG